MPSAIWSFEQISVRGGRWSCACCGQDLGAVGENYRSRCVARCTSASATMGSYGMRVRERAADPDVLLTEFYCPGCATCVRADVGLAGDDPPPAPQLTAAGLTAAESRA